MSVFLTIITGVLVFVIGQSVIKLVIEPVQKFRQTLSEITYRFTRDHVVYHNADAVDKDRANKAYTDIRDLGARLHGDLRLIPHYSKIRKIFGLPESDKVIEATDYLIKISNHMYGKDSIKYYYLDLFRMEICECLDINDPIRKGMPKEEVIKAIKVIRASHSA